VPLERSRLKALVSTRSGAMADLGWEPEWEVNPQELKLVERIGEGPQLLRGGRGSPWELLAVGRWGGEAAPLPLDPTRAARFGLGL
jgi:hypothetical protein